MSSSNCCFLTCTQVSQEAGQVVWYSRLFQNFPQFVVIYTVKGFGIVSEEEVDVFSGTLLLFCWSNRCWQFDLLFLWLFLKHFFWSSKLLQSCHLYTPPPTRHVCFSLRDVITHLSTAHECVACGKNEPWVGHICVWILSFKSIIWRVDYFIYLSISLFSF